MRYKLLGRSGLRVSEICLGTMTFGESWGWGSSKEDSRVIYDAFREAGGNFIDTANYYTGGESEEFLGEFIAEDRERVVLATKYTLNVRPDDPNGGGNHRKNMVQSVEASLKRLATEYLDLLWLHAWDFMTPVDEVMRGLDDLVRAGKVLYVGISDAPAWIVSQANTLADLKGWSPFVGLQIEYSLIQRTPERDLLPMASALDIAVTPWSPLGSGVLSGKYADGARPDDTRLANEGWAEMVLTERNLAIAAEVGAVAADIGRSSSQVAIGWIRQQRQYGVMIPIIGARTLAHLHDNLGCVDFELDDEQLGRLDQASRIELGFPHDFLKSPMAHGAIFGETYDSIDNHRARS
jgi:aryl-alcohol dehydrogenase-like predicted oxidoreductase